MIKAKVIDLNFPQLYGKVFELVATEDYHNSLGEDMTWYAISTDTPDILGTSLERLYLGAKQIELIDSEPFLKERH